MLRFGARSAAAVLCPPARRETGSLSWFRTISAPLRKNSRSMKLLRECGRKLAATWIIPSWSAAHGCSLVRCWKIARGSSQSNGSRTCRAGGHRSPAASIVRGAFAFRTGLPTSRGTSSTTSLCTNWCTLSSTVVIPKSSGIGRQKPRTTNGHGAI